MEQLFFLNLAEIAGIAARLKAERVETKSSVDTWQIRTN